MKYVIHNAEICDGTGSKPYAGDILIENDKIGKIVKKAECPQGLSQNIEAEHIDAGGKLVTPGFVDTHRHCELSALYDDDFGTLELAQGLTSVVGGNCGLGIFPCTGSYSEQIYNFIEPCLGNAPDNMCIENYSSYMKRLKERGSPLHMGCYQGLGAVLANVKGYGKAPLTKAEMDQAKGIIRDAMDAGSIGLTSGLMYQPECYTSQEEMVELLKEMSPFHRLLACHIRGEGDSLVPSVQEIVDTCRIAEVPLNISHFKATGIKNWGKNIYQAIEIIENARSQGQDVTVDFYPYCGGSTTLISLVPPEVMEDDMNVTFRKLQTVQGKEQFKASVYKEHPGWDNMAKSIGWERILISSVMKEENRAVVGMNIQQAAEKLNYSDPADLVSDLLASEQGKVGIIVMSMSQEDVDTLARLPYSMLISDGLYGVSDCPHPRLYGSFPHFLQDYVVNRKIFTVEQAIRKMTSMPAERLNLQNRGILKEGYFADVNIFALNEFRDRAVYENSKQLSEGLSYVFIDGKPAIKDGRMQKERCASLLSM